MTNSDQPTALDLPMLDPLPEATQKYFDICAEKWWSARSIAAGIVR